MRVEELDTPALCVDLDVLEKNISDLQSACNALDIPLRVHTKTHKTPAIAQMQIRAGAIGIVSQKIGEAAAMADAGIEDILIPYNIVGPAHRLYLRKAEGRRRLTAGATRPQLNTDDLETQNKNLLKALRLAGNNDPIIKGWQVYRDIEDNIKCCRSSTTCTPTRCATATGRCSPRHAGSMGSTRRSPSSRWTT